jgi:hypothetical protein
MPCLQVEVELLVRVGIAEEVPELLHFPHLIDAGYMQIQVEGDDMLLDFVARVVVRERNDLPGGLIDRKVAEPLEHVRLERNRGGGYLHLDEHTVHHGSQLADEDVLQRSIGEMSPFHVQLLLIKESREPRVVVPQQMQVNHLLARLLRRRFHRVEQTHIVDLYVLLKVGHHLLSEDRVLTQQLVHDMKVVPIWPKLRLKRGIELQLEE